MFRSNALRVRLAVAAVSFPKAIRSRLLSTGSYQANGGGGDALGKSALSLPSTVDAEWRHQAALRAAEKANGQASSPPETDAMPQAPGAVKSRKLRPG